MHGLFMKRMAPYAVALAFVSMVLSGIVTFPRDAAAAVLLLNTPLQGVEHKSMNLGRLTLENGQVLSDVTIAYDTYGRLAPDGRNAILITHGYTSNHHAAGRYGPADSKVGWWDRLIGPGKAIDTAHFFVVSSNVLGSCYGTTGPGSLNPATGKPYGPEFPDLTMRDIVVAQHEFLIRLGVTHLVAVAGPSLGGRQAFQWAVTYPDFMDGIVAVASSPKGLGKDDAVHHLMQRLATDPNWNDGWYYERGGITPTLTTIRMETLKRYGIEAVIGSGQLSPAQREARIRRQAEACAKPLYALTRSATSTPSAPKSCMSSHAPINYSRRLWGHASWAGCRRPVSRPPTSSSIATLDTWPAAVRLINGRQRCRPSWNA